MSLINKMLQDLDARGGGAGPGTAAEIRPVAVPAERWRRPALAAGGTAAVLALAAGGYFGWHALRPAAPAEGPKMVVIKQVEPALPPPPAAPATAAVAAPPAATPAVAGPARPDGIDGQVVAAAPAAPSTSKAEARQPRAEEAKSAAPTKNTAAKSTASRTRDSVAAHQSGAQLLVAGAGGGLSSQQRAENDYRRALSALQEGRVAEAMAGLEQALFTDPRHEAARQTQVGLLLENKRHDEAMRHVQLGLGLDLKQPGMAMILARLQIEKGGPAIETLMRTLPHAGGNAEYLGFLAAALQRAQRHGEAVEQYQAALRLSPQSGVWWMGLGISLQADKRNGEALEAYARARDSGTLTPELQAYVERKLKQLAAN